MLLHHGANVGFKPMHFRDDVNEMRHGLYARKEVQRFIADLIRAEASV